MSHSASFDSFETLLYAAMKYVGAIELEQYNSIDESVVFSQKAKRRLRKRIENEIKHKERRLSSKPIIEVLKRIAVALLVATTVLFTACMCVEKIRDAIVEFFVEWYDEYIRFENEVVETNNQPEILAPDRIIEYREPVLPEDFIRNEITKNNHRFYVEYENDSSLIVYTQSLIELYSNHVSNSNAEMFEIKINDNEGVGTTTVNSGLVTNTLYWIDKEYSYMLMGNLSVDELLTFAESIY